MLYLITTEQRKKIIDEYQARIWLVSCVSLICLVVIFFIFSIPTLIAMQSESKTLAQKIAPLEAQEETMKLESTKEGAVAVTKDLAILQLPTRKPVRDIYNDVIEVFESIGGVVVQGVVVDTLTKTVDVTCLIRDKDVAKLLIDHINTTSYKGANLPYTILSEKTSFTFNQKLTYTE